MPDKKELMIRTNILGYWIDHEINKAYCVVEYVDMTHDTKHTTIYLQESDYIGK